MIRWLLESARLNRRQGLLGTVLALTMLSIVWSVAGPLARAHAALTQQCSQPYSARRDPSNPLMLSPRPGSNPLSGASFFVDGPRHGAAAGAIARLLGVDPSSYPDDYSWARFKATLDRGWLHNRLVGHPPLQRRVSLLEKIAGQPEEIRFSRYSGGGGPGAIFAQVQKIFCKYLTADPGTVPIITTYFIYQAGYCESRGEIIANRSQFQRQINELAEGISRRPAVMLLELDGVATSSCVGPGGLADWETDLRYEINKIGSLPHTVVYVEAGYSDDNGPRYTARVLNAIGIGKIRGFFTNDTHMAWTISEIKWGDSISRLTHGAHFIVNTAVNGTGPKLNPHPARQGIEDLCNPPGRGIGPQPTTRTAFRNVDAFLWTGIPGLSTGFCRGGTAPGTFWLAKALDLASRANNRLGPHSPSRPY